MIYVKIYTKGSDDTSCYLLHSVLDLPILSPITFLFYDYFDAESVSRQEFRVEMAGVPYLFLYYLPLAPLPLAVGVLFITVIKVRSGRHFSYREMTRYPT